MCTISKGSADTDLSTPSTPTSRIIKVAESRHRVYARSRHQACLLTYVSGMYVTNHEVLLTLQALVNGRS